MVCCALYACVMAFPIKSWQNEQNYNLTSKDYTNNVSLLLLHAPWRGDEKQYNRRLNMLLLDQHPCGYPNGSLVPSITDIIKRGQNVTDYYYPCHYDERVKLVPSLCTKTNAEVLVFRFKYYSETKDFPYGYIAYNYAGIRGLNLTQADNCSYPVATTEGSLTSTGIESSSEVTDYNSTSVSLGSTGHEFSPAYTLIDNDTTAEYFSTSDTTMAKHQFKRSVKDISKSQQSLTILKKIGMKNFDSSRQFTADTAKEARSKPLANSRVKRQAPSVGNLPDRRMVFWGSPKIDVVKAKRSTRGKDAATHTQIAENTENTSQMLGSTAYNPASSKSRLPDFNLGNLLGHKASDLQMAFGHLAVKCEEAEEELADNWGLWYLVISILKRNKSIIADSPWSMCCTTAHPLYNPKLAVCINKPAV